MTRLNKIRYEIDLSLHVDFPTDPTAGTIRPLTAHDLGALAHLMIDAYRGTIDSEDETLDDAIVEVDSWYRDAPMLSHSFGVESGGRLISAVMVSSVDYTPFVGYVMTAADHKSKGLGSAVVEAAFASLHQGGHHSAVCYITRGNTASERLFASMGAVASDSTASHRLSGEERRESGVAYLLRFRRDETVGDGATRILTSLVDEMVGYLDDPGAVGVDVAIHEVRRRGKQARALVRLIRPAVPAAYQDLNRLFRDAGRLLADARDARVMIETFDQLAADGIVAAGSGARALLVTGAEATATAVFEGDPSGAAWGRALLVEAAERAGEFEAPIDGASLVAGATSTYRAGRTAFRQASTEATPTTFHTWRKRVKDHRHQIAFVWECHPVEPAIHDLLYELSDALGAAHDLAVLSEHLGEISPVATHHIDRRRAELERSALELGESLYRVKPKEFSASLAMRWKDWRRRD